MSEGILGAGRGGIAAHQGYGVVRRRAPELRLSGGIQPRGQEISREVLVEITPDKPISLSGATSTDDSVMARLETVPDSGEKKIKVIATLKVTAREGQHQGFVLVNTSSALKPQLKIPIRGTVTKSE